MGDAHQDDQNHMLPTFRIPELTEFILIPLMKTDRNYYADHFILTLPSMATGFRRPCRNDALALTVQTVMPAGKQVSSAKDGNAQDIKRYYVPF